MASLQQCLLLGSLLLTACAAGNIRGPEDDRGQDEESRRLIVGGERVGGNEFNHFASMRNEDHFCGGVLVSPSYVATTATCLIRTFEDTGLKPPIVRLGSLNDLSMENVFDVECVVVHPDFNDEGLYPVADLALVKLAGESTIKPIPLNDLLAYPSTMSVLTLLGFGSTINATSGFDEPSPSLQQVTLPFVDFEICQVTYGTQLTPGFHICAGEVEGIGGCVGDAGGPLVGLNHPYSPHTYNLVGVYSFDPFSCGDGFPDVFTPIAPYALWIRFISSQPTCPGISSPTEPPSMTPSRKPPTPSPTPNPTPTPTPAPTVEPAACICFSEDATVDVLGQGKVAMKDLQVGQQVFAGYQHSGFFGREKKPIYETVYGFGHRNTNKHDEYLRITTSGMTSEKQPLEISGSHLIFVQGKKDPVRADSLQVGQYLLHKSLHHTDTTPLRITRIELVIRKGLYQPLTKDGTILVDGVVASTYVSVEELSPHMVQLGRNIFSEQAGFHWWMAPHRFVCTKVAPQLCANDVLKGSNDGLSQWLALGKSIMRMGEKLPTCIMAIYIAVVMSFCGAILTLDSLLEGHIWAAAIVATCIGIHWLWLSHRRCTTGKQKID